MEVDTLFALWNAFGPKVPLRFDPNVVWKLETAIKYGRKIEGLLKYLEDPVRGQEKMAKVRKAVNNPLGSEDIILSDHHFWGGIRVSMELSRICEI